MYNFDSLKDLLPISVIWWMVSCCDHILYVCGFPFFFLYFRLLSNDISKWGRVEGDINLVSVSFWCFRLVWMLNHAVPLWVNGKLIPIFFENQGSSARFLVETVMGMSTVIVKLHVFMVQCHCSSVFWYQQCSLMR